MKDLETAIDRLIKEKPGLFNFNETRGDGQYRVLDRNAYIQGLINNLAEAGLCAEMDIYGDNLQLKSSNDFSENYAILTSADFLRRPGTSYVSRCSPANFPVESRELIAKVYVIFFNFRCPPGASEPAYNKLPVGCMAALTATPKDKNENKLPDTVHGPDIDWDLRWGSDVVDVDPDPNQPFNKFLYTKGVTGEFSLCASVQGVKGCLNGTVIP
jgi:hypothetical protein